MYFTCYCIKSNVCRHFMVYGITHVFNNLLHYQLNGNISTLISFVSSTFHGVVLYNSQRKTTILRNVTLT